MAPCFDAECSKSFGPSDFAVMHWVTNMGSEPNHLIWTQQATAKIDIGHFIVDRKVVMLRHFPK